MGTMLQTTSIYSIFIFQKDGVTSYETFSTALRINSITIKRRPFLCKKMNVKEF